jgi:hypothetical protein
MQANKAIEPDFRIISLQNYEELLLLIYLGVSICAGSDIFIWTYNVLNLALIFAVLGAILNT